MKREFACSSWLRAHIVVVAIEVKIKVKFTPEQATKAQRGSRGIARLFL